MFNEKDKGIAYFMAIIALAILTISDGGLRYYFFWQL